MIKTGKQKGTKMFERYMKLLLPQKKLFFYAILASFLLTILGIVSCLGLMIYSLNQLTSSALMFLLWIIIGIAIYAFFSYKNLRQ